MPTFLILLLLILFYCSRSVNRHHCHVFARVFLVRRHVTHAVDERALFFVVKNAPKSCFLRKVHHRAPTIRLKRLILFATEATNLSCRCQIISSRGSAFLTCISSHSSSSVKKRITLITTEKMYAMVFFWQYSQWRQQPY